MNSFINKIFPWRSYGQIKFSQTFNLTKPVEIHLETLRLPNTRFGVLDKADPLCVESFGLHDCYRDKFTEAQFLSIASSKTIQEACKNIINYTLKKDGTSLTVTQEPPHCEFIEDDYAQIKVKTLPHTKLEKALQDAKTHAENNKKFLFWYVTPLKGSNKLASKMTLGYVTSIDKKARTFTLAKNKNEQLQYKTYAMDKVETFAYSQKSLPHKTSWIKFICTPTKTGTTIKIYHSLDERNPDFDFNSLWREAQSITTPTEFSLDNKKKNQQKPNTQLTTVSNSLPHAKESNLQELNALPNIFNNEPEDPKNNRQKVSKLSKKATLKEGDLVRLELPNGKKVEARIEKLL